MTNEDRISVDDYNKEVEIAERLIAKGKYIEQDDLEKEVKKWQKENSK
ncbi:MAG: hypothetical protein K8R41_02680 [Bacteroidales bacterium]|nr:hypothetical protein [Bacteroidales bacterium]